VRQTLQSARKGVAGADRAVTVDKSMSPTLDAQPRRNMTIAPAAASPGQRIALRVPTGYMRGVAYSLAAAKGGSWEVRYYLISGRGSGSPAPEWWSVEDSEGHGWPDVGIRGPGPDYVMIPNTALSGKYRLCTANARDQVCELLTIGT
jgi:hypothetical protein